MPSKGQNRTSSPKKIKPIPRKPSTHIQTLKDLKIALKQGMKVQNLKLTKKAQETKSLKVSSLKKLIRYSNSLYSIHVGSPYTEDLSLLLKIQYKIRHIQALQLNKKDSAETHADNGLKKLLIRFKNLKSYKNEVEDSRNLQSLRDFMNQGLRNSFNHCNFTRMKQKNSFEVSHKEE